MLPAVGVELGLLTVPAGTWNVGFSLTNLLSLEPSDTRDRPEHA